MLEAWGHPRDWGSAGVQWGSRFCASRLPGKAGPCWVEQGPDRSGLGKTCLKSTSFLGIWNSHFLQYKALILKSACFNHSFLACIQSLWPVSIKVVGKSQYNPAPGTPKQEPQWLASGDLTFPAPRVPGCLVFSKLPARVLGCSLSLGHQRETGEGRSASA